MMNHPDPAALSGRLDEAADAPSRANADQAQPIYPVDRSFIVEIHRDATFADAGCIGRAEHIASGAVKRFSDSADLLRFLAAAIRDANPDDSVEAARVNDSASAGRA
jgi:hypothetical protein